MVRTVSPAASSKLATRLREMADKLQARIDERLAPRLANTRRRANIADGIRREGEALQRLQSALRSLADLHQQGTIAPELATIQTKKQLEYLLPMALLYQATEAEARVLGCSSYAIKEDTDLQAIFNSSEYYDDDRKLLKGMGIETWQQLRNALLALKALHAPPSKETQRARQIWELEQELLGLRIPGYFPTPPQVVERLLELADIQPGWMVVEPSAGKGNIAEALAKVVGPENLFVLERQPKLKEILELKGFQWLGYDFLKCDRTFDCVVQNPPFEGFQDIDHVYKAYECLRPGGKLVSVVSESPFFRREAKAAAFREWLDSVGAYDERLSEGSFKKSDRPTGVACRIIVVGKQSAVPLWAAVDDRPSSSTQAAQESVKEPLSIDALTEAEEKMQQDWRFETIVSRSKSGQASKVVAQQGLLF